MSEHHIYIHFPYCLYKCHYCDFNSYAFEKNLIPHQDYTQALLAEIDCRRVLYENTGTHFFSPQTKISTVFLGGGTPSLMRPEDVRLILQKLADEFCFADDIEITLEGNPGTVDKQKFTEFKKAGINRISLGVQSLQEKNLGTFGRIHTGEQALTALKAAMEAGFSDVNADLIFGFPGQTLAEWQSDLEEILKLKLPHVSCYALTAEPGTLYSHALRRGEITETKSDLFYDLMKWTYERMSDAHMPAYEISNFSIPGHNSRHNLGYWHYDDYIGLGAGAWSNYHVLKPAHFITRCENIKSPQQYLKLARAGDFFSEEKILKTTAMSEFMMMGLRLNEGVSKKRFHDLFGEDIFQIFSLAIAHAQKRGWLQVENDVLKPTQEGFLFNNEMVQEFLLP